MKKCKFVREMIIFRSRISHTVALTFLNQTHRVLLKTQYQIDARIKFISGTESTKCEIHQSFQIFVLVQLGSRGDDVILT